MKQESSAFNDELPKLVNTTATIGICQKIKTQPPAPREPEREINLKRITADNLNQSKKQDPFMYFSIPEVRDATLQMREIDMTKVGGATVRRNCILHP